jgi:hypothetical protein
MPVFEKETYYAELQKETKASFLSQKNTNIRIIDPQDGLPEAGYRRRHTYPVYTRIKSSDISQPTKGFIQDMYD